MPRRSDIGSFLLLALIAGVIGCGSLAERDGSGGGAQTAGASGRAHVERVVDGDTVILSEGLGSSRLAGVDTPETVKPDTPVQCFGPEASAFTKHVLKSGRVVRYRVAREPVDPYGRTLVYLWLTDGRFFNAMLVRRGYARPLAIAPNIRYAPLFRRLALSAGRAGRGLWSKATC
jgi:micrococcal nuclease